MRYLEALDAANHDDEEQVGGGKVDRPAERIAAIRARRGALTSHAKALAGSGADQISLTDPDVRAMSAGKPTIVGYNAHIAVDAKHKLTAEAQIHARTTDVGLLTETAEAARAGCGLRPRCTRADHPWITGYDKEAVLERMAARLAARPELLDLRRDTVEHPFGSIKQWMDQGAFLMGRLGCIRAEFRLAALAYNIRRVITLVGVPSLIAALRA